MANRLFLMATDGTPGNESAQGTILCAADYTIPLCWLLLFQRGDIVHLYPQGEDAAKLGRYPGLACSKQDALRRLGERKAGFLALFGAGFERHFGVWEDFITQADMRYIGVETLELAMLQDFKGELEADLNLYFDAIGLVLRGTYRAGLLQRFSQDLLSRLGPLGMLVNPLVRPFLTDYSSLEYMLRQCEVLSTNDTIVMQPLTLCGYAWEGAVPWGEN